LLLDARINKEDVVVKKEETSKEIQEQNTLITGDRKNNSSCDIFFTSKQAVERNKDTQKYRKVT
jgi:hypothetical protein